MSDKAFLKLPRVLITEPLRSKLSDWRSCCIRICSVYMSCRSETERDFGTKTEGIM